ncbi:MAG: hypothetical protein U0531_17175 [Dehalococcoidia bacterium]
MSDSDEVKFLTHDSIANPAGNAGGRTHTRLDPMDQQVYQDAITGQGLITITPEQFKALAELAGMAKQAFDEEVARLMTPERAAGVRRFRVDEGCSWRAVAHACYDAWHDQLDEETREGWRPPSNQIVGMALCEAAARHFGEDAMAPPWN